MSRKDLVIRLRQMKSQASGLSTWMWSSWGGNVTELQQPSAGWAQGVGSSPVHEGARTRGPGHLPAAALPTVWTVPPSFHLMSVFPPPSFFILSPTPFPFSTCQCSPSVQLSTPVIFCPLSRSLLWRDPFSIAYNTCVCVCVCCSVVSFSLQPHGL